MTSAALDVGVDVVASGNRKDFGFPTRHARFLRAASTPRCGIARASQLTLQGRLENLLDEDYALRRGLSHRRPRVHGWSTLQLRVSTSLESRMGNRLSRIYTRTGDDGTTGLGDGNRVRKDDVRVEAYGTVDEANSSIGMILGVPGIPADVSRCLTEIQHDLFDLGGELCIPGTQRHQGRADHAARAVAGRIQRSAARAQGFHPAWRRAGRRRLPPRAYHRASRRAARVDAGGLGDGESEVPEVSEPPLGSAVRDRARAGAPREWLRRCCGATTGADSQSSRARTISNPSPRSESQPDSGTARDFISRCSFTAPYLSCADTVLLRRPRRAGAAHVLAIAPT